MTLKERVKKMCKSNGISMNKLEEELGFGKGYISKLGTSQPNVNKLQQIADFFNISLDDLMNENIGIVTCKDCGLSYDSSYPEDVAEHEKEHSAWKNAINKFGKLYCYHPECEKIKAENRNICHNLSNPLNIRYNAQLEVLRCLFSRSLTANGYNLNHVPFDTYVAMMLGNQTYSKNLDKELYDKLKEKYGKMSGIDAGTVYKIPPYHTTTLAAHFDGTEYTKDELEEIRQFAEFVKNRKK